MGEILSKKPLVEAIFELKWELPTQQGGVQIDPNYSFLVGLYHQSVKDIFPFRNDLAASTVPVEMFPYFVQYQFRKGADQWPLTQIGPGILSVNDSVHYSWEDNFKKLCIELIYKFHECYPQKESLKIIELQLRYINAIEFDYQKNDLYQYLKEYLNFNISLPDKLVGNKEIDKNPRGYLFTFVFPLVKPAGAVIVKIAKGKKSEKEAVIFEIIVNSKKDYISKQTIPYSGWLEEAHDQAEKVFLSFIEGKLLRSFK